ncbi:hypothetical protein C8J56DRAFT_971988 [Mycena floridula]|nr:hypothetical protein C8J56DRAFT_971988 [Mycena floridula]
MSSSTHSPSAGPSSSRGRGKSRGGLGKYLRAKGRRGTGRPAEFSQRLLLDGEGPTENNEEDEESAAEHARKFSRRQLGTNADRYEESDPELDSDGEPIVEPEVDLSAFLEKQRLTEGAGLLATEEDDGDVDHSLDDLFPTSSAARKGKVEQIKWTDELDELSREKASAEATWDLKTRFRAKSERLRARPVTTSNQPRRKGPAVVDAPALPVAEGAAPKDAKAEMEDFLDGLIS